MIWHFNDVMSVFRLLACPHLWFGLAFNAPNEIGEKRKRKTNDNNNILSQREWTIPWQMCDDSYFSGGKERNPKSAAQKLYWASARSYEIKGQNGIRSSRDENPSTFFQFDARMNVAVQSSWLQCDYCVRCALHVPCHFAYIFFPSFIRCTQHINFNIRLNLEKL